MHGRMYFFVLKSFKDVNHMIMVLHVSSSNSSYNNKLVVVAYVETLCMALCACSLRELASERRARLESSLGLQQFYRDLDEEETWIR